MSARQSECMAFLAEANDALDETALTSRFEALIGTYGFHSFLMTELPLVPAMGPQDLFIRNNWPKSWWDQYISKRYYLWDPVSKASFAETRPFYWSDAARKYATTPEALAVMEAAQREGLIDGLTFAFSDGLHWKSVVSIGRADCERVAQADIGQLYLASIHFGLLLSSQKGKSGREQITQREREVLLWIACGKTAWEVGCILEISKATVDRHLVNIRAKLNAATNAHAVSLAIISGQLRP